MMFLCLFLILTLGSVHPASAKVLPPTGRTYFDHNACVTSTAYILGYQCIFAPIFAHDLRNCIFNSDLSSPPTFILLNCGSHSTSSSSASSSSSLFQTRIFFKWPCQVSFNSSKALHSYFYFLRFLNLSSHPHHQSLNLLFPVFSDLQKRLLPPPFMQYSCFYTAIAALNVQLITQHNTQEHHQQYHVFSMNTLITPYQNISKMIALSHYKTLITSIFQSFYNCIVNCVNNF